MIKGNVVFGWRYAVLAFIAVFCTAPTEGAERRAVIIGIDKYAIAGAPELRRGDPPSPLRWLDLEGAVNDSNRIRDLLVARFGFSRSQITQLTNEQATREAILKAVKDQLITPSRQGDVAFFYFAGHGSRVRNSLSNDGDNLDETIVPADVTKGARDIRDKELRNVFNQVLDQGASLVAFFDSCHSGSITRGLAGVPPFQTRVLPIDPRDVRDGSQARLPWERGALIISAAQNDQLASEDLDEFGYKGGRFSIAFAKVARTAPVDEPAHHIFRRLQAVMRNRGRHQEPVLEASFDRKQKPLFGDSVIAGQGRLSAAVAEIQGDRVMLQEGLGAGLTVGSELSQLSDKETRVRIEKIDGISRSYARIVAGRRENVSIGDLFVVDRFAPPDVPNLRVWVQETDMDAGSLKKFNDQLRAAVGEGRWVVDPVIRAPTHVILFADHQWQLYGSGGEPALLGPSPSAASIAARLPAPGKEPVRFYLMLPVPKSLNGALTVGANAIERAEPAQADYFLMGSAGDDGLRYAWVRPWLASPQVSALPMRTDWVNLSSPWASQDLTRLAVQLGFVNSWLQLERAPASEPFSYRLALRNHESGQLMYEGLTTEGEAYDLALVRNNASSAPSSWRYVYVYSIDAFGSMVLLFPRAANTENRFPAEQDRVPPELYTLRTSTFDVGPPFGTDSYVLITSSEQLSNPSMLESNGVRTRSVGAAPSMSKFLTDVGAITRGSDPQPVPAVWSIDRIHVVSQPKGQ